MEPASSRRQLAFAACLLAADLLVTGSAGGQSAGYIHLVTSANRPADSTGISYLESSLVDGNDDATIFVAQLWNPPGAIEHYNPRQVGVLYDYSAGKWAIWNRSFQELPLGAAFFVWIPRPPELVPAGVGLAPYRHVPTAANIVLNYTLLSHSYFDGHPERPPMITYAASTSGFDTKPYGIFYSTFYAKWAIFSEDGSAFSTVSEFNVCPYYTCGTGFSGGNVVEDLRCDAGNISGNYCDLDTAVPRDRYLLLTRLWDPGTEVHVTAPLGLWWNTGTNRWSVFTEDQTAMPVGARFLIHYAPGLFEIGFETGAANGFRTGP